jgi:hypothetical protein
MRQDNNTRQSTLAIQLAIGSIVVTILGCLCGGMGFGLGYGLDTGAGIRSANVDLDELMRRIRANLSIIGDGVQQLKHNVSDQDGAISQMRTNASDVYRVIHDEALLLRAQIADGLMNVSGSGPTPYTRTSVQNGTFFWRVYLGSSEPATYSVDVISVGPLTFQLLTLRPPVIPLVVLTQTYLTEFVFYLMDFSPFISQLVQTGSFYNPFPLTAANAAKISVTNDGGCFNNSFSPVQNPIPTPPPSGPFCYEHGQGYVYSAVSRNSLLLGVIGSDFSVAPDYYFGGAISVTPKYYLDGQNFTITSPWEFVLNAF